MVGYSGSTRQARSFNRRCTQIFRAAATNVGKLIDLFENPERPGADCPLWVDFCQSAYGPRKRIPDIRFTAGAGPEKAE
jgi:hypothetical protein